MPLVLHDYSVNQYRRLLVDEFCPRCPQHPIQSIFAKLQPNRNFHCDPQRVRHRLSASNSFQHLCSYSDRSLSKHSAECDCALRHANFCPSTNGRWNCVYRDLDYCWCVGQYICYLWKRSLNLWGLHLRHNLGQSHGLDIAYFW